MFNFHRYRDDIAAAYARLAAVKRKVIPSTFGAIEYAERWDIPTLQDVPDVSRAIELSREHQPPTGPMPRVASAESRVGAQN
jgi:hypothetical protein